MVGAHGAGVTISTLPLFLTSMGATPTQLSLVIASFSAAQMLGCPALVSLSGRVGRLPVLLLCLAGAAAANLLTAISPTVGCVTAARLLAGLFAASVPVRDRPRARGPDGAQVRLAFPLMPATRIRRPIRLMRARTLADALAQQPMIALPEALQLSKSVCKCAGCHFVAAPIAYRWLRRR